MFKIFTILAVVLAVSFIASPQSDLALKTGDPAPDFRLPDFNGKYYKLSEYKGKSPVVVYFYPKAGTSGCTKEALRNQRRLEYVLQK